MKRNAALNAAQLSLDFDAPAPPPPLPAPPATPPAPPALPREGMRRIALGQDVIDYRIRRARRRSIGFQIDHGGLTVSAPRWVRLADIDAAVAEKQRWIRAKLTEWHAWRRERRLHDVRWACGGVVPYLGAHVTLRQCERAASTALREVGAARELHVALPTLAGEAQWRDTVRAWLQARAHDVIGERLAQLAARCPRPPRAWALSFARSQWGSCTHDGRIRLNWRLVHFSLPAIDYVAAHELAHLVEMNHGARFWRTVAELLPGFEAARDEIRRVDLSALDF